MRTMALFKNRFRLLAVLVMFAGIAELQTAQAEITNCDGVWTTEPCHGKVQDKIEEKEFVPPADELRDRSARESLVHDLTMAELSIQEEFGEKVLIDDVTRLCEDSQKSLEDCEKAVHERQTEIDQRRIALRELKIKETEAGKSTAPTGEGNLVIIQDNSIYGIATPTPLPVPGSPGGVPALPDKPKPGLEDSPSNAMGGAFQGSISGKFGRKRR